MRHRTVLIAGVSALLAAASLAVFWQTPNFGFVYLDDNDYVFENPTVAAGLTWQGVVWAFSGAHFSNWHPLTWLSHMVDCQAFGLEPGWHHLINVVIHTASCVLLFLLWLRMTGALWPSAFVAAVFAIHPLHVESVAWVSERKDMLSGLLVILTLLAYARYARQPFSWRRYLPVLLLFALGLMAKPMLVTVPLLMLLLDYWPLERFAGRARTGDSLSRQGSLRRTVTRLILEKLPLFALSAASCLVTLWAQSDAMQLNEKVPLGGRLLGALVSYVIYLWQSIYPVGLALLYPHPEQGPPLWQAAGALLLLASVTCAAVLLRRSRPYFVVGWLWYLIMLLPVIGIVQVGSQARADRYMYLPQIGLCVAVAWAAADLLRSRPALRTVAWPVALTAIALLMAVAFRQTAVWRDSETLWTNSLKCTADNSIAHNNLGRYLAERGRFDEALSHYQAAVAINPRYAQAEWSLGYTLCRLNRLDEAFVHCRKAVDLQPESADAHNNLALVLVHQGKPAEAAAESRRAIELRPGMAEAHLNLGLALGQQGDPQQEMIEYWRALELNPRLTQARINLGAMYFEQRQFAAALAMWREALQSSPDDLAVLQRTVWILAAGPDASLRNGPEAVRLAEHAIRLRADAKLLTTLAAAYAEAGRFADAVQTAQRALQRANAENNAGLVHALQSQIELYRANRALRDTTLMPVK